MTEAPTRILIVDDSAVVRGLLSKIIAAEPDMELAGSAPDGAVALEKAARLRPDVIVLDIEMPVMTGLEALVELRALYPKLPIIMFSTLTERGASVTLDALSKGASDYAAKPTNTGSSAAAREVVREELFTKVRALAKPRQKLGRSPATARPAPPTRPRPGPARQTPHALVIGSSTGGPAALEQVLGALKKPLPVPTFIVQHMPSTFTGVLASRLDAICPFPVHEATAGMMVEPGVCYLAPGGQHLRLAKTNGGVETTLDEGPRVKSCRPSVDVLFDSAREIYGNRLAAAVLTGMGDDGCDAAGRLADLGIEVIVQDEESSVVWGMPGAVAKAGFASKCLPLAEIPRALLEAVGSRPVRAVPGGIR